VSAPTPAGETAALALLDADGSDGSPADLEPALMRLKLISDAREKGIPWSAIGGTLGMTGKEAKASAKRLARYANRRLFEEQARERAADHGGPYEHVVTGPREARDEGPGVASVRAVLEGGDPQKILAAIAAQDG
jgi:hypothetical protein